jgi:beta-glucuronidase
MAVNAFLALCILLAFGSGPAQALVYTPSPATRGALEVDGQTDRYLLGGTWLYRADKADVGINQGWWKGTVATDGWSPVTIPNSYNAGDFTRASELGWVGWYRRDFTLPSGAFPSQLPASERHWIIRFQSVDYSATVWLNGHLIGSHAGAYLPFEFDLTGLRAGANRLIVRVDNHRTSADFPPGPYGQWWSFGGILQEVYLRAVAAVDVQQVQVRPVLRCPSSRRTTRQTGSPAAASSGCTATIEDQVLVRNVTGEDQSVTLTGRYGRARLNFGQASIGPHRTWTARASVRIRHPKLWAPGSPTLYKATVSLSSASGIPLGGYVTYSGIRSITVTKSGQLELNGRVLHLRGVNLHEQNIATGAALDTAQLERLVGWVRRLGATIIRAHYPLNPQIEEMADRDGILLWSEVPVYQTRSRFLGRPTWLAGAYQLVQENILDNQNHPSVLLWSIGNELPSPVTKPEAAYIAGAAALAHKLDPTRPVGMAVSNNPGTPCQAAYAPLDVIGINEYFGWFDTDGGANDDRDALSPYLNQVHACYPTKALFITEFGFDANRPGPVEERGTYAFQANSVAFHLGVFAKKRWLSGALYFLLQDYVAYPGYNGGNPRPTPPFNQKGLVDLYGDLKPAFAVVSRIYHHTVQIAPARR